MDKRVTGRLLYITGIILVLITAVSAPAVGHTGDDGLHHHDRWMGSHSGMDGWMGGGLGWIWMLIWPITLIGIPLAFGYWLITHRETSDGSADTAIDVLRRRYAQGEIDEEEFETRRKTLGSGGE